MSVVKTHKKVNERPRKVSVKKTKPKKNGLAAVDQFVKLAEKYNLDFNYIKE